MHIPHLRLATSFATPLVTAFLLGLAPAQTPNWVVHTLPPIPGALHVEITDLDGTSSSDLWAVGWKEVQTTIPGNFNDRQNLALHFDGTSWTEVPTPQPPGLGSLAQRNYLNAIGVVGPNNIWAVGQFRGVTPGIGFVGDQIQILHWNGSQWSAVPAPLVPNGAGVWLDDVVVAGPNDVWLFGFDLGGVTGIQTAASYRWNGSSFQVTLSQALLTSPGPHGVNGIAARSGSATSPNDVWMCGSPVGQSGPERYLCRWNGSSWTHTGMVTTQNATPRAIEAVTPTDIWVALGADTAPYHLLLRWNGTSWASTAGPQTDLRSLASLSPTTVLAGGQGGVYRFDGSGWALENAFAGLPPGPFGIYVDRMQRIGGEIWAVIRTATGNVLGQRRIVGGFATIATGCGPNTLTVSGSSAIGGTVTWTTGNIANLPLLLIGLAPQNQPLCAGSPCRLGTSGDVVLFGSSATLVIPSIPAFVGVQVLVQGADLGAAGPCVGLPVTVTDTIVLTIG